MLQRLECTQMLGVDGLCRRGEFALASNNWETFEPRNEIIPLGSSPYLVPLLPVDFHRHAIGGIDLSDIIHIDLEKVDQCLSEEQLTCVLTMFLARHELSAFCTLARDFHALKGQQKLTRIVGLSLEGPLLSSPGGTPPECAWNPTSDEWKQLAECGKWGLKYVVLSPDADVAPAKSIAWVIELLLESGISPALGHFRKNNPKASALAVRRIYGIAEGQAVPILSDHLFNDMPLLIRHAWRTAEHKACREIELDTMDIGGWQIDNIGERLGPVPAELIKGATEGKITLCMNFDGEHVDLAVAREIVRIAGPEHIIVLTDRVDGNKLARQDLLPSSDNGLLYRQDGVVVAGTTALDKQMTNMRRISISEEDIWKMSAINPCRALSIQARLDLQGRPYSGCFVDAARNREMFDIGLMRAAGVGSRSR